LLIYQSYLLGEEGKFYEMREEYHHHDTPPAELPNPQSAMTLPTDSPYKDLLVPFPCVDHRRYQSLNTVYTMLKIIMHTEKVLEEFRNGKIEQLPCFMAR
jgi:hypothetical protein